MAKREWAPDYVWMEPLRILLVVGGPMNSKFQFWKNLIGGSQPQQLYYLPDFCAFTEPFAPDWTMENFVLYGPNELLKLWAERELYRTYCTPGE